MTNESRIQGKPIIYSSEIQVRFADLDPYGHVNATHYPDFVISSRWQYGEQVMGIVASDLIMKGLGFFTSKITLNYQRPIIGMQKIRVSSHVNEVRGTRLLVPFEIRDISGERLHCSGEFEFAVIDLRTMKPQELPSWAERFFFENGEGNQARNQ